MGRATGPKQEGKKMNQEIKNIIKKIREYEQEAEMLCNHQSWGAAEGATERKCHQIDILKSHLTDGQKDKIDQVMARAFLGYMAKGPDYQGPYPSAADLIEKILEEDNY